MTVVTKGDWVRARWMQPYRASVAGAQPKFCARQHNVSGIVRHVRGDHPTNPTSVRLWVEPEGGGEEVLVDPDHVIEHNKGGKP